jgi:hypothetical protein
MPPTKKGVARRPRALSTKAKLVRKLRLRAKEINRNLRNQKRQLTAVKRDLRSLVGRR